MVTASLLLLTGCAQTAHPRATKAALPVEQPGEATTPVTGPTGVPSTFAAGQGVRILSHLPTTEPVVYVGIDDGNVRLPEVARMIQERHLPVSLFIVSDVAAEDPAYFRGIVNAGAFVEDHTMTHPLLTRLSQAGQQREICGGANREQELFGRRPTLFRPPYGAYNAATLRAMRACGLDTLVLWDVAVNDGVVQFQSGRHLKPGDIVLMHFRKSGVADLSALLRAVEEQGLHIGSLLEAVAKLPPPAALPLLPPVTTAERTQGPVRRQSTAPLPRRTRSPRPLPTTTSSRPASASATAVPSRSAAPQPSQRSNSPAPSPAHRPTPAASRSA